MSVGEETWTTLKVLNWTKEYLAEKGIENSRLEAEWLLASALNLDRIGLYLNFDKPLSEKELATYRNMVSRRAKREPLQYIMETQEFYGLEFNVSPAVLIPRHDTEILVSETLKRAAPESRILDIGTGSGCIAITLASNLPEAEIYGVDLSSNAILTAKQNAKQHDVHVTFLEGSLFEPIKELSFDIIVSNPPYIPSEEINSLQPEVKDYEPQNALDGGVDGLEFYRLIIKEAHQHMEKDGWLLFETGINQADSVVAMLEKNNFKKIEIIKDLSGIERVVCGCLIQCGE
ncbi:MAG: peptide chain release factor N(5)-glutamine methyltransferase [Desulfuromonadales bacterium]|nr:peptide chain release factor N(5)-glutamine methyltransferase [Desulfuromonadales bacterium]